MKKIFIVLIIGLFLVSACKLPVNQSLPTPLGGDISDATKFPVNIDIDSYTISKGNSESDTVILISQGGPIYQSNIETLIFNSGINDNYLWVMVDQFQVVYPQPFLLRDMEIEELETVTIKSVELLYNAAKYYHSLGKKVVIAGGSYGAFLVQNLIAEKGMVEAGKYIDKYIILAGRLKMPKKVWESFLQLQSVKFNEDGKTIEIDNIPPELLSIKERNTFKLLGIIGRYDYITLLEDKITNTNGNKIFYAYGTNDQNVGTMLPEEVEFMKKKKFVIYKNEKNGKTSGNHVSTGINGIKEVFERGFLP